MRDRALVPLFVVIAVVVSGTNAAADLAPHDANDVGFRLDIQMASSISTPDSLGLGVQFYEAIARRRMPQIRILYDAFGSSAPDFVLRFHYYRQGTDYRLRCDFVRLSDRAHLSVSPPDDQPDYVYCEFPRPRRMGEGTGIRWRVAAVIPGVGRDHAPDAGWYPHT